MCGERRSNDSTFDGHPEERIVGRPNLCSLA
jgi:hypothetical protein